VDAHTRDDVRRSLAGVAVQRVLLDLPHADHQRP